MHSAKFDGRNWILLLLPLAWLWFRLLDHLHDEWTLNPQYTYGWAVPSLCAYLLWRKAKIRRTQETVSAEQYTEDPLSALPFSLFPLLLCLCALAYLPTRLIQEANPEWRLVSWALALEVIGLSLLLLHALPDEWQANSARLDHTENAKNSRRPAKANRPTAPSQPSASLPSAFGLRPSDFIFPLCFFLVAVPWPTILERPLIRVLTRANVRATIELLSLLGFPAVQHGNVIEVATGLVGIDDACCGIRSIQATLMISLFFGEVHRLSERRRVACVLAGFVLAFLFNVGRTLLLASATATRGVGAVADWHDPAGITVLAACFASLWLITWLLRCPRSTAHSPSSVLRGHWAVVRSPSSLTAFSLIAWFLLAEIATELWYRTHEWRLPGTTTWQVKFPRSNATYRDVPFSDQAKRFLRFDEGHNGAWQQGPDQRWQAIFLRWNPGRIAVHLANSHTPEVCLTAAGRELISQSPLRPIRVRGLQLPFQSCVVKDEHGPLYVYYCLWEDRAVGQSSQTTAITFASRLAPVLAGRRNSGQRSLEVAISGIADPQETDAALARHLEQMLKID